MIGPNGAGKTTVMRCLLDIIRPTSGASTVLGENPRTAGPALRRRVGYLPGELFLEGRITGRRLLSHYADISGPVRPGRVDALAERLGLDLDRHTRKLSKGNKEKLGLVQAFMHDPELLVLDEPTSGLDPLVQQEFLAMVREAQANGQTVFLSSHMLSEVQQAADTVAILRDGRIITVATVDSLREGAVRHVRLTAAGISASDAGALLAGVPGIGHLEALPAGDGVELSATLGGAIQPLLRVLATLQLTDLVLQEPDLEESVLELYGTIRGNGRERQRRYERRGTPPAEGTRRMSKPLPLFTRAFVDSWRATLGWAAGLAAAIFIYLPLYPSIGASPEMQGLMDSFPPEMIKALNYDQITSGPGYTQATMFGLIGFLLMTIASVAWGAAAVGGDEESGQLELTLAHGVTRTQVVLERALAILARVLLLVALVFVLIRLLTDSAQLNIRPENLFGASVLFAGLAMLSGSTALFAGAVTGRKTYGLAAGAGVGVLGYVFNAVGRQSTDVDWLLDLSPYSWAYGNNPVANGADWAAAGWLWGISAVLVALSAVALSRRDVGT